MEMLIFWLPAAGILSDIVVSLTCTVTRNQQFPKSYSCKLLFMVCLFIPYGALSVNYSIFFLITVKVLCFTETLLLTT